MSSEIVRRRAQVLTPFEIVTAGVAGWLPVMMVNAAGFGMVWQLIAIFCGFIPWAIWHDTRYVQRFYEHHQQQQLAEAGQPSAVDDFLAQTPVKALNR